MVLVFDLGGSVTRIALAVNGELLQVARYDTDRSGGGFDAFLSQLKAASEGHELTAVAGGLPGQFKGADGELEVATNLPEWLGVPVAARLRELFAVPVFVANDVEMCGLGEARFGNGTIDGVMAYYTVSTGVNAVRLIGGEIDPSVGRFELGKQIVSGGEQPTALEPLIGGAALRERYQKPPHELDAQVWTQVEHDLAVGVYNTVLYWNPVVVVFGGSMMRDIDLDRVAEYLGELPNIYDKWPRLVKGRLGDEAGLRGAVASLEHRGFR